MSALQLHVTPAGLAAIVNAENTGTAPVVLSHVGLTDRAFSAEGITALPGEFKRLNTLPGAAVANDTIHITIRDDSADSYTLRGFGLYFADGTLFAVYSHAGETPDYIMQKAAAAMLLLQSDMRFTQINATSITFGSAEWLNPPATTTVSGVARLADGAQSLAGADASRAVTPAGLKTALDGRFGEGAPSGFVKDLLSLATAALIRTAIGLGSAALRDEGHGKGLDADKLDGQEGSYYRAWSNITGKPDTYTPESHRHPWAQLDNVPATATRWPSWSEVADKPTAFPPAGHPHAAADITSGTFAVERIPTLPISQTIGLQNALESKASLAGAAFTGALGTGMGNRRQLYAGWAQVSSSGGGNVLFGSNAVIWQDNTLRYAQTHANFGASGIVLNAFGEAGPWFFDMGDTAATADEAFTPNLCRMWHSGNFDPASKANAAHNHGNSYAINDTPANAVGLGWVGSQVRVRVDASTWNLWHTGNFDPSGKASLGANVAFSDVYAHRGNGTGVIFLNAGDRYLHWDGGRYVMPGGALNVGGGFDFGSSRKLKDVDGPMPYGLAEVRKIATLIGRYKPDYVNDGRRRLFFDAEQFMQVMPEVVNAKGVRYRGEDVPTIKIDQTLPPAYRAIAQLADLVDELRAEVAALKAGR